MLDSKSIPDSDVKKRIGNFGIFATFEPSDLDFYRSYLPDSLSMPETPLVNFYMMDMGLLKSKLGRFYEGGILLLCERNGKLGWVEVGVPINNPIVYIFATIFMGSRKLMAQKVCLEKKENGKWIGEVKRLSKGWKLEFIPKPMSELGKLKPWQEAGLKGTKYVAQITEPRFMISKINRKIHLLDCTCVFPGDNTNIHTGTARLTVDHGQEFSGLVKNGSQTPAVFLRAGQAPLRNYVRYAWTDGIFGSKISKIPALMGLKSKPPVRWDRRVSL